MMRRNAGERRSYLYNGMNDDHQICHFPPTLLPQHAMSRTLSLPLPSTFDSGSEETFSRFPHSHLRAQLGCIHRQYKPLDSYEIEGETDDSGRVSPSFVQRVVTLLEEEHEDELKTLLQRTYAMDDETVRIFLSSTAFETLILPRLSKMFSISCTNTEMT
jgi:hypothetical protein